MGGITAVDQTSSIQKGAQSVVCQLPCANSHNCLIDSDEKTTKYLEFYLIDAVGLNGAKSLFTEVIILMMLAPDGQLPVIDKRHCFKPSCLAYRTKPAGGSHPLCDGISIRARAMVGRGAFGHAILATICAAGVMSTTERSLLSNIGEEMIFKVDLEQHSVVWEAFIHATVSTHGMNSLV
jgi:hypothetical protein